MNPYKSSSLIQVLTLLNRHLVVYLAIIVCNHTEKTSWDEMVGKTGHMPTYGCLVMHLNTV